MSAYPKVRAVQFLTYLYRIDLDPSNQATGLPVKETNSTLSLNTKQNASSQALGLETNIKSTWLLNEILEDLDARRRLSDCIIVTLIF
jgi:hypothetical protein